MLRVHAWAGPGPFTGDRHDTASPTHARRHASPESVSAHATVVRATSLPIRKAFWEISRTVGLRGDSRVSGVLDQGEEARREVDQHCRLRPSISLHDHPEERLAR